MSKYPMPMSRYLREQLAAKPKNDERTEKFNATADKLLPDWNKQPVK